MAVPSYHRPTSVAQALELKASLGSGAVFLAGGTIVNHFEAPSHTALIDLAGLGFDKLEATPQGLRIGAGVTFQQLVEHEQTPGVLKSAAEQMANRNIRNLATVGGQLAVNSPCADLLPTLLAAEARVSFVDGQGERELPIEKFMEGPSGLILSVFVPATERGFGLLHHSRTSADISIVSASVSLALEGDRVQRPILAFGGVAPHAVRLHDVEQALDGQPLPAVDKLEARIAEAVHPIGDLRGSAPFKRHLAAVLGGRALRAAVRQLTLAQGGR